MARTLKRLVISAFLIGHLAAVVVWNLPPCAIKARCATWSGGYLLPLGLWQYWGMFAPEPARETVALEAVVVDARGLLHTFAFPTMADRTPWRAALGFRHSKFAANLAGDEFRAHREMAARHAARNLGLTADDFPVVVQLQYQVRDSPPPGAAPADPPAPPVPAVIETYRFPTLAEAQP